MADRFVDSLVIFAQEDPANLAALKALRLAAFQRIQAGGGEISSEVSGTMNGQSFTFQVAKSADVLFSDLTDVITIVEGGGTSHQRSSRFDFSCLQH